MNILFLVILVMKICLTVSSRKNLPIGYLNTQMQHEINKAATAGVPARRQSKNREPPQPFQ